MVALDKLVLGPKKDPSELNLVSVTDGYSIDKKSPFVLLEMPSGQKRWLSTKVINGSDVREIVKHLQSLNYHQSIHINTGGHGDLLGNTVYNNPDYAEASFIIEDFHLIISLKNVSLHTMSSMSDAIYPKKANHIIDAWCFSQKSMEERQKRRKKIMIINGLKGSITHTCFLYFGITKGIAIGTQVGFIAGPLGVIGGGVVGGAIGIVSGAILRIVAREVFVPIS